jgi:hypothetical protein
MAKATKNSRNITVGHIAYRWRARGQDGQISISIWPAASGSPVISASIGYDQTGRDRGVAGVRDIVVTNRIVRRIIELAVSEHGYVPDGDSPSLRLGSLDGRVMNDDAVVADNIWF